MRASRILLAGIVVVFLAHALFYAFIEDDAFIFLRYARNLLGHRRRAPESYLRDRKITFVLGHPRIRLDPRELAEAEDIVVEVVSAEPGVNDGRNFYLGFRTTGDRGALSASLRDRGVRVLR